MNERRLKGRVIRRTERRPIVDTAEDVKAMIAAAEADR